MIRAWVEEHFQIRVFGSVADTKTIAMPMTTPTWISTSRKRLKSTPMPRIAGIQYR